ncbi:MAG: ATP-binding protein [Candidatus Nitrosocosmicus sp.]
MVCCSNDVGDNFGPCGRCNGFDLFRRANRLGLVAPFTAFTLLGDSGAILLLTVLFTVVISAGSAQITSVTSLVTFDIFKRYLKPSLKDTEVIVYSRAVILFYGLAMGVFASILFQIGVSLEYVYLVMGILIGSAVAPIILTLVWEKTKSNSMTAAAIVGIIGGTISWMISASLLYGDISLKSTGEQIPLLIGNVTSISLGAIVTILGSSIERFTYKKGNKQIQHVNSIGIDQKGNSNISSSNDDEANQKQLSKESKTLFKYATVLILSFTVFVPLPLYFSGYVFSSISLHIWIWIVILWTSVAGGIMIAFPVIESRNYIIHVTRNSIIPLVFIGITLSTIFTSSILYLHYSDQERYVKQLIDKGTLIQENTLSTVIRLFNEQMYTSFVLAYIIIGVMGAFSLTTLLLNRRSRKLVELTKIQKKELEKVNEELVKLGRVKEEFINTAAHELRTPIQPILVLTDILSNRIKDNEQKKCLVLIKRNAQRLRRLANDILDVSKMDSGQLHLDKQPFNMNEVILNIISESQDQDKEIKINFVKILEGKELFVVADKEQISRVLFNLINNAIKFTDKGDIIVIIEKINSNKIKDIHEIHGKVQVDEINYIIVKIKDFGIGIHSEIMPRLFSKFASKSFQGTGLGLYISKSIVEAHGGNIWAENNKNEKGATFSFSLPLKD